MPKHWKKYDSCKHTMFTRSMCTYTGTPSPSRDLYFALQSDLTLGVWNYPPALRDEPHCCSCLSICFPFSFTFSVILKFFLSVFPLPIMINTTKALCLFIPVSHSLFQTKCLFPRFSNLSAASLTFCCANFASRGVSSTMSWSSI